MNRIAKPQAKALYNRGETVIAIPHKMNPENQFFAMGAVLEKLPGGENNFDKLCDQLAYYNCSNKTGYYLAFYTE